MGHSSVHDARFVCATLALLLLVVASACGPKNRPAASPAIPDRPVAAAAATTTPAPAAAVAAPATAAPASGAAATSSDPAAAARRPPGPPPLTGIVTREVIESFNDVWKGLRAQDYQPDATAVAAIRDGARDVEVLAVVATWCPDTRRDLPRFFKIADQAQVPAARIKLLAVDRTKKDADGLTAKWNVTRVPTFIFLRGGTEIGRVVEKPTTTLEQDIANIVKK